MKTTLCLITPIRKEKFLFRDSMEQIALRRSFFLQKTRFGNGNKTIAGFQTPAQTALFACSHMPEKPVASFGLFTGARGLEGARPSCSHEQHFLTEDQSSAPPNRPHTAEVGNFRPGIVLVHSKRSGGRLALRLPRPSFPRGRSAFRPNPDHMLQGGKEKKRRTGNSDATPLIRWGERL